MKYMLTMLIVLFVLSGCSKTWEGVKEDSSSAWKSTKDTTSKAYDDTKKAIHEATAD